MFDPVRICAILNEEGVDYVVVGGMAAVPPTTASRTRNCARVRHREQGVFDP